MFLIEINWYTSKNISTLGQHFGIAKSSCKNIFAPEGTLFVGNRVKEGNVIAGVGGCLNGLIFVEQLVVQGPYLASVSYQRVAGTFNIPVAMAL